jgi:aminopeptidase-like protein
MDFKKLQMHLFTHPQLSDAIPYLTSYYQKTWGFCLSQNQLSKFDSKGTYKVVIKSKHFAGALHSGEIFLKGKTKKEILLSTYICHPSLANNELSGPAVLTALSAWLSKIKDRHYSYRITFHSETLGALAYITGQEQHLKENVIAAWNFTCMGGPDEISILPTQYGNSLADKVTWKALKSLGLNPKVKNFLTRGSDERQFSSPRLGIPMVSIMKSPYGEYKEYHTSLDNLDFISEESMTEALEVMKQIIVVLEEEKFPRQIFIGEAHLNKYGLYESLDGSTPEFKSRDIMNVMQYCDGTNSSFEISQHTKIDIELVESILKILISKNLVE